MWRKIYGKIWKYKGNNDKTKFGCRYNYKNKNRNFKFVIGIKESKLEKSVN